jgi:hypothetical protein
MGEFLGEPPRVSVVRDEVLYAWIGRHLEGTAWVLSDYLRDHQFEPTTTWEGMLLFKG